MKKKTKVATLSATNFKGSTFTHQLAPVTLFYGPPREGKSTRLEALTLALLGYLPSVGKKGSDLFARLSSGASMGVGVDSSNPAFNGGQGTGRRWREVRGSVKYEGSGDAIDFPPVALDASVFLDLSGPEQVKALFRSSRLGQDLTVLKVCSKVADAVDKADIEGDFETRRAIQREVADFVLNYTPEEWDNTVQSLLDGLVAEAEEKKKTATQSVQRMEKTMQGLTQTGGVEVADAEAETKLAAAREALLVAERDLAAKNQAGQTANAALGELKSMASSAVDETEARAELRLIDVRKAEALHKCQAAPPDVDGAVNAYHEAFINHGNAVQAFNKHRAAVEEAKRKLSAAKNETTCPHCGQSVVALKAKLVEQMEADVANLLAVGLIDPAPLIEELNKAEKNKRAALDARQQLDRAQSELRELTSRSEAIVKRLDGNSEASKAKSAIPAKEQELNELRSAYAAQNGKVKEARSVVTELEAEANALIAQRAADKQRAEAATELERCRIEERVYKVLLSALRDEVAAITEASVGGLLAEAGVLFRAVLGDPLAYKDGVIGLQRGETFWAHRSFSGTERALFEAGLSYALAKDAPLRIVVLDELGRMDAFYKQKLVWVLLGLIESGDIDQAVLADPGRPADWGFTEGQQTKSIKIEKE